MELQLFSVRDSKGEAYSPPRAHKTVGEAERMLETIVNEKRDGNFLNMYPADYALYHLGTFDDQTGKMKLFDSPRHLHDAINFKKP